MSASSTPEQPTRPSVSPDLARVDSNGNSPDKMAVVAIAPGSGGQPSSATTVAVTSACANADSPAAGPQVGPELLDSEADSVTDEQSATGFANLALAAEVVAAVERAGYRQPTDIQARIIPPMLAGRSVLAQSQTGSGKTAAFALPIISRINLQQRKTQTLVLAPTRELAIQVARSFSSYSADCKGFSVTAIYGGQSYEPQLQALRRGAQVVVGTPGRVIDHIKRGTLDLSQVNSVVLDEADEMLHMGFIDDVKFVLEQVPASRQVALFSATMPEQILRIAQRYLDDPVRIKIDKTTLTVDSVRQRAVVVGHREKTDALVRFLEIEETDGVIVFTKTRDATMTVAQALTEAGFSAVAMNGDMQQKVRERTIEQLKSGRLDVLVATDVAARGLDVRRISHVFNYDMPVDAESYTHRIGRTGRAGRSGEAILFVTHSERRRLAFFERTTRQSVEIVQVPRSRDINLNRVARFRQKIEQASSGEAFEQFRSMLEQHTSETGQPPLDVAAALAALLHAGRPFFASDKPVPRKQREMDARQQRANQHQQRAGGDRYGEFSSRKPGYKRSEPRFDRAVEPGMVRYRIEVGHDHNVKPGNIVGAVANEAGMDGSRIGTIQIHADYSTIDLPEGMPKEIYRTLQKTRVVGQALKISRDGQSKQDFSRPAAKSSPQQMAAGHGHYASSQRAHNTRSGSAAPARGEPAVRKGTGNPPTTKPPQQARTRAADQRGGAKANYSDKPQRASTDSQSRHKVARADRRSNGVASQPRSTDGSAAPRRRTAEAKIVDSAASAPAQAETQFAKPAGRRMDARAASIPVTKKPKKISTKKKARKLEKKLRKKQARKQNAARNKTAGSPSSTGS